MKKLENVSQVKNFYVTMKFSFSVFYAVAFLSDPLGMY